VGSFNLSGVVLCLRLGCCCVLQADLTDPTSLPATLVGISAIIDCATARPEESTQKVDWEGKVALIQCAQVRGTPWLNFLAHHTS
jgi:hypothetical protein